MLTFLNFLIIVLATSSLFRLNTTVGAASVSSIQHTEDTLPFRVKGVAPAHGTGICKVLEYTAARERHILAPLYADFSFLSVQSGIYSVQTSLQLS